MEVPKVWKGEGVGGGGVEDSVGVVWRNRRGEKRGWCGDNVLARCGDFAGTLNV